MNNQCRLENNNSKKFNLERISNIIFFIVLAVSTILFTIFFSIKYFKDNKKERIVIYGCGSVGYIMKELAKELNENSNYYYDVVIQSSYEELKKINKRNLNSHSLPHITICYPDHACEYIFSKEKLFDFNNFLSKDIYKDIKKEKFVSQFFNENELAFNPELNINGKIKKVNEKYLGHNFVLPLGRSTDVLYINNKHVDIYNKLKPANYPEFVLKDFLKDSELTWDEFFEWCRRFKDVLNPKNLGCTYEDTPYRPCSFVYENNFLFALLEQRNAKYSSLEAKKFFTFDSPDCKKILNEMNSYYQQGLCHFLCTRGLSCGPCFRQGESSFSFGSSGNLDDFKDETRVELRARRIPISKIDQVCGNLTHEEKDRKRRGCIAQGPSVLVFNKEDTIAKLDGIYNFVKNLFTKDFQTKMANLGYCPSVADFVKDLEDKCHFSNNTPNILELKSRIAYMSFQNLEYLYLQPPFCASNAIRYQFSRMCKDILEKTKSVDDAVTFHIRELNLDFSFEVQETYCKIFPYLFNPKYNSSKEILNLIQS